MFESLVPVPSVIAIGATGLFDFGFLLFAFNRTRKAAPGKGNEPSPETNGFVTLTFRCIHCHLAAIKNKMAEGRCLTWRPLLTNVLRLTNERHRSNAQQLAFPGMLDERDSHWDDE